MDGGWLNFAEYMAKSKRLARGYQVQAANLNKKKFPFVGKDSERITEESFLFFHLVMES